MSVPTLSPVEQREVTRFGIHDLDILADMELHADDVVQCVIPHCGAEANLRMVANCCRAGWELCAAHYAEYRARVELKMRAHPNATVRCPGCPKRYRPPASFDRMFTAVTL